MTQKGHRAVYKKEYPRAMYLFFSTYSGEGTPSFRKFAASIGATAEDIKRFRDHREFERAYRECSEIRRDYLIDNALAKRFDPSFTKFLLSTEYHAEEADADDSLEVRVEVVDG